MRLVICFIGSNRDRWCGPCRVLGPKLESLSAAAGVKMAKLNVDESPDASSEYGVSCALRHFQAAALLLNMFDRSNLCQP